MRSASACGYADGGVAWVSTGARPRLPGPCRSVLVACLGTAAVVGEEDSQIGLVGVTIAVEIAGVGLAVGGEQCSQVCLVGIAIAIQIGAAPLQVADGGDVRVAAAVGEVNFSVAVEFGAGVEQTSAQRLLLGEDE
jgi:hypothetical protein